MSRCVISYFVQCQSGSLIQICIRATKLHHAFGLRWPKHS